MAGWRVNRYLLLFSFPPTKQDVTQVARNVSQHLPPKLAQGPAAVGQIFHVSDYLRVLIRILWGVFTHRGLVHTAPPLFA